MRDLTQQEMEFVSGGNIGDAFEIMGDIISGIIDGPVTEILNLVPNTISGLVKLSAQALTGATQLFFFAVGILFW